MQLSQKFLLFSSLFAHAVIIPSAAAPVRPSDYQLRTIIKNDDVTEMARYLHNFPEEIDTQRRGIVKEPLILQAVKEGALGIIELLIMSGADTQVTFTDGYSGSNRGIWHHVFDCVIFKPAHALAVARLLQRHKVGGINRLHNYHVIRDCKPIETTPLMEAALRGSPELFQIFLEAGADITVTDTLGCTVLDFINRSVKDPKEKLAIYNEFVDRQKKGM